MLKHNATNATNVRNATFKCHNATIATNATNATKDIHATNDSMPQYYKNKD
jgi:hypothetical protein